MVATAAILLAIATPIGLTYYLTPEGSGTVFAFVLVFGAVIGAVIALLRRSWRRIRSTKVRRDSRVLEPGANDP
jgi:hypothetical protein